MTITKNLVLMHVEQLKAFTAVYVHASVDFNDM